VKYRSHPPLKREAEVAGVGFEGEAAAGAAEEEGGVGPGGAEQGVEGEEQGDGGEGGEGVEVEEDAAESSHPGSLAFAGVEVREEASTRGRIAWGRAMSGGVGLFF
jgi:hypothetical protein